MDYAIETSHFAVFHNMGQCCIAGTRTFVQEDIYDEFVKRSRERAEKRVVGDPYDSKTESGPNVSHMFEALGFCYGWWGSIPWKSRLDFEKACCSY